MGFLLAIFFGAQISSAQTLDAYDCQYMNGAKGGVYLEDFFSPAENMRLGSIEIRDPQQTSLRWDTRVYQFLMPDNERYIQMWYASSEFHVDGQFSASGINDQFFATLKKSDSLLPLLCRKK